MKITFTEKLSPHKYKTPEGYLICVDAVLARTGNQEYNRSELFHDAEDSDEVIKVDRPAEEVFNPRTLASFENKPLTITHPEDDVDINNYNDLAVGFVRDIKRGVIDGQEVMLGTLVVTNEKAISDIENGVYSQLSCGYNCDIETKNNQYYQKNIRGNHVALCKDGRAGIAHIVDSADNLNDSTLYTEREDFNSAQWRIICTGLEKGFDISKYANPKFTAAQMQQILMGMEDKLDISKYANPNLTWQQMDNIRMNLKFGANRPHHDSVDDAADWRAEYEKYEKSGRFDYYQLKAIEEALEDGIDVSKYADPRFNALQMSQIFYGIGERIDVSKYANPKFNNSQMFEIRRGLLDGVNVSKYADTKFNSDQMCLIRVGLNMNLNISKYADPNFNVYQMEQIVYGLEERLDVSMYANPNFTWQQMEQIRKGLKEKINVSEYADPNISVNQMQKIRKSLKNGTYHDSLRDAADWRAEYEKYEKSGRFNSEQLDMIRSGLKYGLDVSKIANPRFDGDQMGQILEGLERRVDISKYADPKFNYMQMFQILWGLEDGLNVSWYADPKFNADQMDMIRRGLKDGLDVSKYADSKIDWHIMQGIMHELENGTYRDSKPFERTEQMNLLYDSFEDAEKHMHDDIVKKGKYWTNEGREGTHGKFTSKEKAREQQKAMFANGYQADAACEDAADWLDKYNDRQKWFILRYAIEDREDGIDISKYLDPRLTVEQMQQIRRDLYKNYTGVQKGFPKFNEIEEYVLRERSKKDEYHDSLRDAAGWEEIFKEYKNSGHYNDLQLEVIRMGLKEGLNILKYTNPKFSEAQMLEIRLGLLKGLDVSKYANLKFNADQMSVIRNGLQRGLDISKYANPKFDMGQMGEILLGLAEKLDVSKYADPKFNWWQMKKIRENLEKGTYHNSLRDAADWEAEYEKYEKSGRFSNWQLKQIWSGLNEGLDVSKYANPKFDDHQMYDIRAGLAQGLDISKYADPKFNNLQMDVIIKGLKKGLDVSKYANPKFDNLQMTEIQLGLELGLDVSKYADPKFAAEQMFQIRKGLEKGLDVSKYADPKFEWYQMKEIRGQLIRGTYHDSLRDAADWEAEYEKYEKSGRFNSTQLYEIRWGLKYGVDVSKYADPKFNADQMDVILNGLRYGLDVSKFADPKFNRNQMEKIFWGLYYGVDISKFADPKISAAKMEEIRYQLQKGTYHDSISRIKKVVNVVQKIKDKKTW